MTWIVYEVLNIPEPITVDKIYGWPLQDAIYLSGLPPPTVALRATLGSLSGSRLNPRVTGDQ